MRCHDTAAFTAIEEMDTMTRYPNPFRAFAGLIANAFAALDERDHGGWRRPISVVPSRSRARRLSRTPTTQAKTTSPSDPAEQKARAIDESETMLRR
jgi:hypothetical protein